MFSNKKKYLREKGFKQSISDQSKYSIHRSFHCPAETFQANIKTKNRQVRVVTSSRFGRITMLKVKVIKQRYNTYVQDTREKQNPSLVVG